MRVVAFDTATARTTVALRDLETEDNVCLAAVVDLALADDPPPGARPGHAQRLLVMIHELFEQAGAGWDAVDRIAVGVGPGTFTGLRIGIATAEALGYATSTPLLGISTLRSLALGAHEREPDSAKLAVIDARRGEAFVAGWGSGSDPLAAGPELSARVLRPDQLVRVAATSGTRVLAVGDGALKFRDELERGGASVPAPNSPLHLVAAREHCRLAAFGAADPTRRVEPEYLRPSDAELAQP